MIRRIIYVYLVTVFVLSGCNRPGERGNNPGEAPFSNFVSADGQVFRDRYNRELILYGINMVIKDPSERYVCHLSRDDIERAAKWGFNVIRLGIIWDGLEPEPGQFDEDFLKCLDERIAWAKENNIYVILDMHQDLYSVMFSDGAPEWATITDDLPHGEGSVWSDAYLISPAVQTAFDHFWNNTQAPDGIGIQDHYAALWQTIAQRYADETTVVGYDLMNEPFVGTGAQEFMPAMIQAYMTLFGEQMEGTDQDQLFEMWSHPDGRARLMETLADTALYARVINAVLEKNQAFEEGPMMAMYTRVGAAIREVDTNHILFLEHSYFSNPGVPSAIRNITYEDGRIDQKMAYAPHGYDLVVDTKAYREANNDRVAYLFNIAFETSRRLQVPMLVGEWGAFHNMDEIYLDQTEFILQKFEEYKCSQTYWAYYQGIGEFPYFGALLRPRPTEVAGDIGAFRYRPDKNLFTCSWVESELLDHPSNFFLPGVRNTDALDIKLEPSGNGFEMKMVPHGNGVILSIDPIGKNSNRNLSITF